jgi:imidazole glycerol phosphate synthase subunit HisF
MSNTKRIIPCLDVKVVDGQPSVVKGVKFVDLKRQGDPSSSRSAMKSREPTSWSSWI